ncbi:MAG TPA: exosortase E/protease, VPEID-CTERM system [Gemmataceae bacterium]|nr:exosortase E/protease, VPEID-CTERM system [Gemmataceae bacterium]
MSSEALSISSPLPSIRSLPLGRWAFLGVLLVSEVMILTVCYDTAALYQMNGWWADLMGESWIIPQVCVAVTAALLLFSGTRMREELQRIGAQGLHIEQFWSYLAVQITVYLAFANVTEILLGGHIENYAHPELWALLWAVLAGATGLTWMAMIVAPRQWLSLLTHAWVPLLVGLVLGVAAWGAGRVTTELWRPLSEVTLWLVHALLSLFTNNIVYDPATCMLGTSRFAVTVSPACSGYEGIGLIWVFLGGYLWFFRTTLRFPQALLLFPVGTLVIFLANALRIFSLILLGTYGSADIAMGGFHSQAGWLALNMVALGLVGVAGRSRFISTTATEVKATNYTAAYLVPMLVIVLVMMLTMVVTHQGFDYYYPVRVFAGAAALWHFRKAYQGLSWHCSWEAVAAGVGVFVLWMAPDWYAQYAGTVPASDVAANETFGLTLRGMGPTLAGLWLLFRVVGAAVTVPIAEELAFRGYLCRRLIGREFQEVPLGAFTWFSFILSSVVFGILHGRFVAGTLAGLAFALVLYRTKRLSDPIWAHGITNGLIAVYVLSTSTWTLW